MIFGTGIDIVQVDRIERAYRSYGERFARKILGPNELEEFAHSRRPVRFLAMRFAAKEAMSKALGTGFKSGVSPRLIEVRHSEVGKPSLHFLGRVQTLLDAHNIFASHVSLADEQRYATAFVVLETCSARK